MISKFTIYLDTEENKAEITNNDLDLTVIAEDASDITLCKIVNIFIEAVQEIINEGK